LWSAPESSEEPHPAITKAAETAATVTQVDLEALDMGVPPLHWGAGTGMG
jgi:hypothetical protein